MNDCSGESAAQLSFFQRFCTCDLVVGKLVAQVNCELTYSFFLLFPYSSDCPNELLHVVAES